MAMFYDLNVSRPKTADELLALLQVVAKLGYNAVAITTNINEEYFKPPADLNKKGKKKKIDNDNLVPPPFDVAKYLSTERFELLNLKIFNRINISIKDHTIFHIINQNKRLKEYDIISYSPGNQSVLKALTSVYDFDILCFNPSIDTPSLYFTKKLYNQFVQNGVHFELPYGPAIIDATHRKYCFYQSAMYHAVGKSENIIVTSAGYLPSQFRTPYDIMNLSLLFGLSEQQSKDALTRNASKVLLTARTKRRGKSTMEVSFQPSDVEHSNASENEFSTMMTIDNTFE